jgi:hypothetical protein
MGSTGIDLSAGMVQRQGAVDLSAGLLPKAQSGAQVNDVGNLVITPRLGESFGDTMKRAAAYGKTVTPDQLNAEEATIPGKAATVLASAPAIGATGTAALASLGALPSLGKQAVDSGVEYLKSVLPEQATMDRIVKIGKMVRDLSVTAYTATSLGKYLYNAIYGSEGK